MHCTIVADGGGGAMGKARCFDSLEMARFHYFAHGDWSDEQ